jgi:DNA primase
MDIIQKNNLIGLLNKILKQTGKLVSDDQITYLCPFHSPKNNILRRKFGIRLSTGESNCFACGESGKSYKSLFRKLKVSKAIYAELYSIIGEDYYKHNATYKKKNKQEIDLKLPEEFLSIAIPSDSIEYKHAVKYIKSRGITRDDILRYNIGYCEKGEYNGRIIIPSYDKNGNINFFAARAYYAGNSYKYKLPSWSKNIVGFELFINWKEIPIIVESPFNAITIRNNAIPLFGKIMPSELKEAFIENDVEKVNICLDNDAEENSKQMGEELSRLGIKPYFIKLNKKDPNEIGFDKMNELIDNAVEMDYSYRLIDGIINA